MAAAVILDPRLGMKRRSRSGPPFLSTP